MNHLLATLASAGHGAPADLSFFSVQGLLALATLAALEIVLGIDNVIVIALLSNKLPAEKRLLAQRMGIVCAVATRIGLLFCISLLMKAKDPIDASWPEIIPGQLHLGLISWKDLILVGGGFFLIWKSTKEIHHHLQEAGGIGHGDKKPGKAANVFAGVIVQIMLVDIIFSLDSVITAVGMSNNLPIMITAVVISAAVMAFFAKPVAGFIEKNPTVKVLALAFLILVGVAIIAEGLPRDMLLDANGQAALDDKGKLIIHHHNISKGIIYTAMVFSLGVEFLNIWARKKGEKALRLADSHLPNGAEDAQA